MRIRGKSFLPSLLGLAFAIVPLRAVALPTGPRMTEAELFARHLNVRLPAFAQAAAAAQKGDLLHARELFAKGVRAVVLGRELDPGWREPCPKGRLADLLKNAERIKNYELEACGFPCRYSNRTIDWKRNPMPNAYREFPFQLSRHSFWTPLAEYYVRTGDEDAARTWVDQVSSWIGQVPVPTNRVGIRESKGWRTLDAGLRSSEWSHQLSAFAHSAAVTDEFLSLYFRSVWEHGNWLCQCPTKSGNWAVSEMAGLLHIGKLYPFFAESEYWCDFSFSRLMDGLEAQFYPDGFQIELSTRYHTVVVDAYAEIARLYVACGEAIPPALSSALPEFFGLYLRLVRPDGRLPSVNDGRNSDVRPVLRDASIQFPERGDFLWFVTAGEKGVRPAFTSFVFPYSGAVVFRTSWKPDAIWAYMDASPFGFAHQHEDKLNVLLHAYGKDMLLEGGNYAYDDSDMRKYVVSTRAHNTVRINGFDQNQGKSYRWEASARLKKADVDCGFSAEGDWAESSFSAGYGPDLDRTTHRRRLLLAKDVGDRPPFLLIVDRMIAPDETKRTYEILWHLSCRDALVEARSFSANFGEGVSLVACCSDREACFEDMKGVQKPEYQGWYPHGDWRCHEGGAVATPVCKGALVGSRRVVTVLNPMRGEMPHVVSVDASSDIREEVVVLTWSDGVSLAIDESGKEIDIVQRACSAARNVFSRAVRQYRHLDEIAAARVDGGFDTPCVPRSWDPKDGLVLTSPGEWTAGHFAGVFWLLYGATKDPGLVDRAVFWTELLTPNAKIDSHHDIGFIMNCSFGNARRMLGTDRYDGILVEAAGALSRRFDESIGLIRCWGAKDDLRNFKVIPDTLMNLELLEVAARISVGSGSRFDAIARSHANVTDLHHFREDGGVRHVLDYDQETKRVRGVYAGQGASCETAWSRGQSWAIYGYAMMYRETKDRKYLSRAVKSADFAINHPNMPLDGVPYWDYVAKAEERDTSAAAIMASALVELSSYVEDGKAASYRAFAAKQLLALTEEPYFASQDENGGFLLKMGVGNKPRRSEVGVPLVYGDYYFLEGLVRLGDMKKKGKLR